MSHQAPHKANGSLSSDIRQGKGGNSILILKKSLKYRLLFFVRQLPLRSSFAIVTMVALIGSTLFLNNKVAADEVYLYPSTCLGGWKDAFKATSKPPLEKDAEAVEYTSQNSAILLPNDQADIFCGDFEGGIPEGTEPASVLLNVYLGAHEEETESILVASGTVDILQVLDSTSTESILTNSTSSLDDVASSTDTSTVSTSTGALDSNSETSPALDSNVEVPGQQIEEKQDTKVPEEKKAEPVPTQETPSTSSEQPQSSTFNKTLLDTFVSLVGVNAYAQEESQPPVVQAEVTSTSENEAQPSAVPETPVQVEQQIATVVDVSVEQHVETQSALSTNTEAIAQTQVYATTSEQLLTSSSTADQGLLSSSSTEAQGTSTPEEATSTALASSTPQNEVLEVSYTLDGNEWIVIGTLDSSALSFATFELKASSSLSWKNLKSMQVKVRALQSLDTRPVVYLAGIELKVVHQEAKEKPRQYDIASIENFNEELLSLSVATSTDEDRTMLVLKSSASYGVAVYDDVTNDLLFTTQTGEHEMVYDPNASLPYGKFVFILTRDESWCSQLSKDECLFNDLVIASSTVSIIER